MDETMFHIISKNTPIMTIISKTSCIASNIGLMVLKLKYGYSITLIKWRNSKNVKVSV